MVQISNLLKQSSDSNLIQGFVTSPVRCILTFSQIRHFKRIDLKLLFNSYAFHEYYCWAFENLINTLGGPMTDYLSVLVILIKVYYCHEKLSVCVKILQFNEDPNLWLWCKTNDYNENTSSSSFFISSWSSMLWNYPIYQCKQLYFCNFGSTLPFWYFPRWHCGWVVGFVG